MSIYQLSLRLSQLSVDVIDLATACSIIPSWRTIQPELRYQAHSDMAMETTTTEIDLGNTPVCEEAGYQLEWSSIISTESPWPRT